MFFSVNILLIFLLFNALLIAFLRCLPAAALISCSTAPVSSVSPSPSIIPATVPSMPNSNFISFCNVWLLAFRALSNWLESPSGNLDLFITPLLFTGELVFWPTSSMPALAAISFCCTAVSPRMDLTEVISCTDGEGGSTL